MMIAVTFHHHGEAQRADAAIHCQDCEHHVHHDGHLLALQHTMHDCVLCQLQSTPYLSPTLLTLVAFIVLHRIIRQSVCAQCQEYSCPTLSYNLLGILEYERNNCIYSFRICMFVI